MKFTLMRRILIIIFDALIIIGFSTLLMNIILWNSWNVIIHIIGLLISIYIIVVLAYYVLRGPFSNKFIINSSGVVYIKNKERYTLSWDQINFIGIAANKQGFYNKNCMIYFDGRGGDSFSEILEINNYYDHFFGVQYRKIIISEIEKYWHKPIQGLYQIKYKPPKHFGDD